MASLAITPPEQFKFSCPHDWPKWIRRFDRFRETSELATKSEERQINTLIYSMGDKADDILASFALSADERKQYSYNREREIRPIFCEETQRHLRTCEVQLAMSTKRRDS